MANPNWLSRFWQQLKRRNVHRSMAVYGGTAYIIFEASTLIFPRWGLPEWTIDLLLYVLIFGALITFILSWVYDISPSGFERTRSAEERGDEVTTSSRGWKLATYISLGVTLVLIAINVVGIRKIGKMDDL